jgi:transposase
LRASHHKPRGGEPVRPEHLERENERLNRENEKLRQELNERDKKIAELERKLALRLQNSTTSSKPPSSDGMAGEQRPRGSRRKKSRRKPGGQPGHRGYWRGLAPLSRVDQVIEVFPPKCRHCDSRLSPRIPAQGEARRHQVTELPRIAAHITEYQCQCLICPECGEATQAELPREAQGHFGPQLTALIAYLTVVCRMPRRMVRELLEQVLAIPLSLGSIQNSWEEASEAVAGPCAELERQLPHEPVVNSDETGYRTSGEKRWLWALVAASFVFYKIALTRGAEVLVELLGEVFAGILCSDRCASYLKYHKGEGQFCWAHFKRNILGIQEIGRTTDAERFCRDALALHARLFRLWHRFRDGPGVRYGPVTRQQLIAKSIPLEKKFFALADRYLDSCDKDVANLALALMQHFERFFAFLRHEGVEPTNNVAERALRCAVQWRKISFGSRSARGEVAVARLLTVTRTCRMQNRAPLVYLVAALHSYRNALPIQSLLKTASTT